MLLRTLDQTGYKSITMDEIQDLLKNNRHSYLQPLDDYRYTITGLARDKYYIKCETITEVNTLTEYYEKITGRPVVSDVGLAQLGRAED
ncbi:MAG: hypothetical protein IJF83_03305 [Methanobrevibacter sp.]|nr:hypothetical protein [Methanobrevibacter sp.]